MNTRTVCCSLDHLMRFVFSGDDNPRPGGWKHEIYGAFVTNPVPFDAKLIEVRVLDGGRDLEFVFEHASFSESLVGAVEYRVKPPEQVAA